MDCQKFNKFLLETCAKLTSMYPKVGLVMDNASYHTVLVDDIPHSNWLLSDYKKFCTEKELDVVPINSKRKDGHLVKADYKAAADKFVEESRIKYKADQIMKSYGVKCICLPPYHPELNPIERV